MKVDWGNFSDEQKKAWVDKTMSLAWQLAIQSQSGNPAEATNNQPVNIFWYIIRELIQPGPDDDGWPKFFARNKWISAYIEREYNKYKIAWGKDWAREPIFITIQDPTKSAMATNETKAALSTDKTIIISLIVIAVTIVGVIIFKRYKNG
jgi:hypothetical protein